MRTSHYVFTSKFVYTILNRFFFAKLFHSVNALCFLFCKEEKKNNIAVCGDRRQWFHNTLNAIQDIHDVQRSRCVLTLVCVGCRKPDRCCPRDEEGERSVVHSTLTY